MLNKVTSHQKQLAGAPPIKIQGAQHHLRTNNMDRKKERSTHHGWSKIHKVSFLIQHKIHNSTSERGVAANFGRNQGPNRWRRGEKAVHTNCFTKEEHSASERSRKGRRIPQPLLATSSFRSQASPQPRTWSAGWLACWLWPGWMFNSLATPAAHAGWSALAPKLICVLYYFIPSPAPRHFFSGFNHFASNRHSARRVRRKIIVTRLYGWARRAARTYLQIFKF